MGNADEAHSAAPHDCRFFVRQMAGTMQHTKRRNSPLGAHLTRRVAVEAPADPRTVRKVLLGHPVSPMAKERVLRVLSARGLEHLVRPDSLNGDKGAP